MTSLYILFGGSLVVWLAIFIAGIAAARREKRERARKLLRGATAFAWMSFIVMNIAMLIYSIHMGFSGVFLFALAGEIGFLLWLRYRDSKRKKL